MDLITIDNSNPQDHPQDHWRHNLINAEKESFIFKNKSQNKGNKMVGSNKNMKG